MFDGVSFGVFDKEPRRSSVRQFRTTALGLNSRWGRYPEAGFGLAGL